MKHYTNWPAFFEVDHSQKQLFLIKRGATHQHLKSGFLQKNFIYNKNVEDLIQAKRYRFFLVDFDEAHDPTGIIPYLEEIVDKYNLDYVYYVNIMENLLEDYQSTEKVKLLPSTCVNYFCKFLFKYTFSEPNLDKIQFKNKFFLLSGVGRLGRYNFIRRLNLDKLSIKYRINRPSSTRRINAIFKNSIISDEETLLIYKFVSSTPINNISKEELPVHDWGDNHHYQFYPGSVPDDSFLEIVNETYSEYGQKQKCVDEKAILISEKVFKPMFCYRPFIVNANPGYYRYLKKAGFKTFDKFWDESFDDELDYNLRYKKIIQQIEYINSLSFDEIHTLFQSMKDILEHNAKHAYDLTFFKKPEFYTYL
tara:strand:+ start:4205 stop:5299 length:1095 start_codon:yes stop_codon:yes gene_type:complete